MDFAIVAILGLVGAALIVGGIVAYRGSPRVSVRVLSAASVAAGVVMWAIILFVTPVSRSADESPTPIVSGTLLATATVVTVPAPTSTPVTLFELSRPDPYGFQGFARTLGAAVEQGDVDTLVALTRVVEVDCREGTHPGPPCPSPNFGKILRGILVAPWASEFSLRSTQDYRLFLTEFLEKSQPDAETNTASERLDSSGLVTLGRACKA